MSPASITFLLAHYFSGEILGGDFLVCSQPRGDEDMTGSNREQSGFRGEAGLFLEEAAFTGRPWSDSPKGKAFPERDKSIACIRTKMREQRARAAGEAEQGTRDGEEADGCVGV